MARSTVEQSDLEDGYTLIESVHALLGVGANPVVAIRGGTHPKMRLLVSGDDTALGVGATDAPSGAVSFALALVANVAGAEITVEHANGMDAATTLGNDAISTVYPFKATAKSAIVDNDALIFEANEDVMLIASVAAGGADDSTLVVLKFEVVN